MELSLFLAKIFGLWFLIVGIVFIWRRKSLMSAIEDFADNRALVFVFAILELFAGIALITSHNIWEVNFQGVLTILGWWIAIEGFIYLLLPMKRIKRMVKYFNRPGWYISGSLLSIILGVYLLNSAFTF